MLMKLTILGLPLGNHLDISLRAIKVIKNAKLVICEDTRVFNRLHSKLQQEGFLDAPFSGEYLVINDFNEKTKIDHALIRLEQLGEGILVSDAGLPTISDPGFVLINAVIDKQGELDIIPGPTAAMTALAISGFSADKVMFLGFLPKKTSKKHKTLSLLTPLIGQGITIILYQSPYRLSQTIKQLLEYFPPSTPAVVVRELTKPHQEIIRDSLANLSNLKPKGEITLLLRL